MASLTDRVGTVGENKNDDNTVDKLWATVSTAYEPEKIIKLPIAYYAAGTVAANTVSAYQQWKVNSIYDPDLTGGGFQPLGRDTWSAIYNYYKVLKTVCEVEIMELTSDSTGGTTSTVYPSVHGGSLDITANSPSSITLWINGAMASNANKQQIFTKPIPVEIINGRGNGNHKYTMTWDQTCLDTAVLDSSTKDTWTPIGSDPDNLEYFNQIAYNPQAVGSRTYIYIARLTYLVAFKQINRTLLMTTN